MLYLASWYGAPQATYCCGQGNAQAHNMKISKEANREGFIKAAEIPDEPTASSLKPSQAPTLAELTAGLPGAIGIPVKLLRFVFNGDIKSVTNVRIVQIAH